MNGADVIYALSATFALLVFVVAALRALRAHIAQDPIRKSREKTRHLLEARGFVLRPKYLCGTCREEAYDICLPMTRTTLAGETFTFYSDALAGVCLRCETVGTHGDASGNQVHVSEWDGEKRSRLPPPIPPFRRDRPAATVPTGGGSYR
jgi:hypothetical protein